MSTLEQARQNLRRRYLQRIPNKIDLLCQVIASPNDTLNIECEAVVKRLAHQVAGSAASYGYADLTDVARRAEKAGSTALRGAAEELCMALAALLESESSEEAKILVIDDDRDIHELLDSILAGPGRTLSHAYTVRHARERLLAESFDLITLDLLLGDGDGRDLLSELRAVGKTSSIPVVVLSAQGLAVVKRECAAYSVDHFVDKPLDPKLFSGVVASCLERSLQHRRSERDEVSGLFSQTAFRTQIADRFPARIGVCRFAGLGAFLAAQGEDAADRVMRDLAEVFETHLPTPALSCRWSPNEFVFAIFDTTTGTPARLEQAVADRLPPGVLVSLGITQNLGNETLDTALARAHLEATMGTLDSGRVDVEQKPSVLIAEDDDDTAELLLHTLREKYRVVRAADGDAAVAMSQEHPFDLVLLDYDMPKKTGLEVLTALRESPGFNTTPILFLTQQRSADRIAQAFTAGADDYIMKPIDEKPFLARLERHLVRTRAGTAQSRATLPK